MSTRWIEPWPGHVDGGGDPGNVSPITSCQSKQPPLLHTYIEPAGAGETDPQLALEHRRRTQLRTHDELHGLPQQLVVVVGGGRATASTGAAVVDPLHLGVVFDVGRLPAPVADDLAGLVLAHP